jgi:two-component system sensor histidine kinase VanS
MIRRFPFVHGKSITYKIFLITLLLLIISATSICTAIYFFLPSFYERNKLSQLNAGVEKLLKDTEHLSFAEAKPYIDDLAHQTNSSIILYDSEGNVAYVSTIHSAMAKENNISMEIKVLSNHIYSSYVIDETDHKSSGDLPTVKTGSIKSSFNIYNRVVPINFADQTLTLNISATLQPVNEASRVLVLFVPYIGIIILLISATGAFFYSKIISKPLIRINKAAKKMADLEFVTIDRYSSSDEIGQLSNSLNEMSANLQRTMKDLHRANEQLKVELLRRKEIEEKRRELFAMISHELKSPLTAVKGQLEGMIHGFGVYKDRNKYLKRSFEILEEMENLIQEILQIAKLEQHAFFPEKENIDLSELICTVINKVEYFAEQKNITIISEIDKEVRIETDKNLIEKAVYNIIHNGVVYSNPGEKVVIKLKENRDTGLINLSVLNTGAHIPEEQMEKIFDPFFRLDKSGNKNNGGNGLGLYLVKKVFEALSVNYSIHNLEQGVLFSCEFLKM